MRPVVTADAATIGQQSFKVRLELPRVDGPLKPERGSALPQPFTRAIGISPRVVIVGSEVVGRAAGGADIGYRQHRSVPNAKAVGDMLTSPCRQDPDR